MALGVIGVTLTYMGKMEQFQTMPKPSNEQNLHIIIGKNFVPSTRYRWLFRSMLPERKNHKTHKNIICS